MRRFIEYLCLRVIVWLVSLMARWPAKREIKADRMFLAAVAQDALTEWRAQ